jgi:hypothetical protein
MGTSLRIGVLCLENSPLRNILDIYFSEIGLPDNLSFHEIRASKRFSDISIDRFQFRTKGFFEKFGDFTDSHYKSAVVDSHDDIGSIKKISDLGLDFGLNLGTHTKLSSDIFSAFRHGVLNCHPGNLPNYRGSSSLEWSLYNHDPVVSTLHLMDESIDTGPIYSKLVVKTDLPLTYFEIRILIFWNTILQPIKWLSDLAQNSTQIPEGELGGDKQGEGRFWEPIPDPFLCEVVESRRRQLGGDTDLLENIDLQDWQNEYMQEFK